MLHQGKPEIAPPFWYRGTSLIRKRTPLGPYRRPVPRVLGESWGGGAFSYERGTPVHILTRSRECATHTRLEAICHARCLIQMLFL